MSKFCPIQNRKVVYLDCQECEDRACEQFIYRPEVVEENEQFHVIIAGTRTFNNYGLFQNKCSYLLKSAL